MQKMSTSPTTRNGRILRRAIIPADIHSSAKLMAKSRSISIGELYDEAVNEFLLSSDRPDYVRVGRKDNPPKKSFWLSSALSDKAKILAKQDNVTEHEVLITAIQWFAKKHHFLCS